MLRSAIELRGESFLWAADLSRPDTIAFLGTFPVNLLPLLMAATTIWQSSLTPASPGMDPNQQKIMKWGLPLMMLFILYNMSAGLTLYWTVQNLMTVLQTKLTKTQDDALTPGARPVPAAPQKKK
jgi:YidC/Oxa1 family membrane protein insertase